MDNANNGRFKKKIKLYFSITENNVSSVYKTKNDKPAGGLSLFYLVGINFISYCEKHLEHHHLPPFSQLGR